MTTWEQVAIIAAQLSGQCSCHINTASTLVALGFIGEGLNNLVNRIQEIYNITVSPETYNSWINLGDINNYLVSLV